MNRPTSDVQAFEAHASGADLDDLRACGRVGSCAEYLCNTVSHLEEFGIRDRNLWRLQELAAHEIEVVLRGEKSGGGR